MLIVSPKAFVSPHAHIDDSERGSRLIVDQMPRNGPFQNVQLHVYPGGHMFYARTDSARDFRRDAMAIYGLP